MKTHDTIKPPSHLDVEARAEWERITPHIEANCLPVDLSLLSDYCRLHSSVVALANQETQEGIKIMGPNGAECLNPTTKLLNERTNRLALLRRDLYFTPKSRAEKLNTRKGKDPIDDL